MTSWKVLAANVDPLIPDDLFPEVTSALEKLEAAFRSLDQALPPETILWADAWVDAEDHS